MESNARKGGVYSMRLSGFIIGSMVGAAATVYLTKMQPGKLKLAANMMSEASSSLLGKSAAKAMTNEWISQADPATKHTAEDTKQESLQISH